MSQLIVPVVPVHAQYMIDASGRQMREGVWSSCTSDCATSEAAMKTESEPVSGAESTAPLVGLNTEIIEEV